MGGTLVTKGGLIFVGASMDHHFHAYDLKTGKLLWEVTLPAMAGATSMTYTIHGKQYVVVAAGGVLHGPKNLLGDDVIAYTLKALLKTGLSIDFK